MGVMRELYEMMEEELDGAKHYAKMSVHKKCNHPIMAKMFYEMSMDELSHATKLHDQIEKEITASDEEESESMISVYDFLHEQMVDKMAKIREYQAMYRD